MSGAQGSPADPAPAAAAAPDAPAPADRITLTNDRGRIAVSIFILFAFSVTLGLMMTRTVQETPILDQMLTLLGTLTTGVVGYWVGSSAGSTEKNRSPKPSP